jgi:hypothetical protein
MKQRSELRGQAGAVGVLVGQLGDEGLQGALKLAGGPLLPGRLQLVVRLHPHGDADEVVQQHGHADLWPAFTLRPCPSTTLCQNIGCPSIVISSPPPRSLSG